VCILTREQIRMPLLLEEEWS